MSGINWRWRGSWSISRLYYTFVNCQLAIRLISALFPRGRVPEEEKARRFYEQTPLSANRDCPTVRGLYCAIVTTNPILIGGISLAISHHSLLCVFLFLLCRLFDGYVSQIQRVSVELNIAIIAKYRKSNHKEMLSSIEFIARQCPNAV